MKNLTYLALLCLLTSCSKKSDSNTTPNTLQVEVSGLTAKTSISIQITNQKNVVILNIMDKFENTTYNTDPVSSGDQLRVRYVTNIKDNVSKDGTGVVKFTYKGQSRGAVSGFLGGSDFRTTTVTIP